MALTYYATPAEIKTKIKDLANLPDMTDPDITAYIEEAEDNFIKVDLGNVVDFTVIDALASVPGWLNRLCTESIPSNRRGSRNLRLFHNVL